MEKKSPLNTNSYTPKPFGVIETVGNTSLIKLRYTDVVLAQRVLNFLKSRGYDNVLDVKIYTHKGRTIHKIRAFIFKDDILLVKRLRCIRTHEVAVEKADALLNIYNSKSN